MSFIHEKQGWPELNWDSETLAAPLAAVRHKQGRLLGKMEALGFDLRVEASLSVLTADVVKSSAIEGEALGRPLRTFFAFDPRRAAILLVGGDKTGQDRFYKETLQKADRLYDEHLEELKKEGLI